MLETTLKWVSISAVVIGVFAILGGEGDYYAFVGGLFYLTLGALSLIYINQQKNKKGE